MGGGVKPSGNLEREVFLMKKFVFVLVLVLALPIAAGAANQTFGGDVKAGDVSIQIFSPMPEYMVVSINQRGLNLTIEGKLGETLGGTVDYTLSDDSGVLASATLRVSDAINEAFGETAPVAHALGLKATARIAAATLNAMNACYIFIFLSRNEFITTETELKAIAAPAK